MSYDSFYGDLSTRGTANETLVQITVLKDQVSVLATEADVSATNSEGSAITSGIKATEAAASAASALSSKNSAKTSEVNAGFSAQQADVALVATSRFCGVSAVAPSTRLDGSELQEADEYQNSEDHLRYSWTGTLWVSLNSSAQELDHRLSSVGGAGLIGFNPAADYPVNSIGKSLQDLPEVVVDAADRAEAAADLAASLAGIYVDTASGLAATTPGKVFGVPVANDPSSVILYKNQAGVAVDTGARLPSAVFVQAISDIVNAVIQKLATPGKIVALTDALGNSTWLEANDWDGGPTAWAAQMLTKSLVPSLVPTSVTESIAAGVLAATGISNPVAEGLLAAITDALGQRTWLEARASDGGPTDWALSLLNSRLSADNPPKTEFNNAPSLRSIRMHLRQIKAGDAGAQLKVGFIGDSYTAGHLYYLNKLTFAMAQEYGFAGPGYIGFNHGAALGDTNFQYSRSSTLYFGGAWSVSSLGAASPDNRTITSTAVGDYISVNALESAGITTAITAGKLLYLGDGSTQTLQYRWSEASAWNTITLTGTGPRQIAFPVLPSGTGWQFRMEVVSGTPTLFGLYLSNSLPGICFSKMAASGSTSGNWFSTDPNWQAQWKAAASLIPMDAYLIMLGGNDQGESVMPEQFLANIQGLVGMVREVAPGADIHLCMRADTSRISTYPMSAYSALLRNWAYTQGIPCSDLQYTFGRDASVYATTGAFPLIGGDKTHPIINTGGRLITEVFYRLLRFSC